jgi:uncharacterized membrane protein YbhN (UPF0104 family)
MTRFRRLLKPALSVVFIICFAWFFTAAFRRNWASLRAHEFHIEPVYLALALVATLVTMLLATYAWYTSLNALGTSRISFRQSVAATNISGLTKYVPGKIWSYALQMYWLDGLGFSKSLILYVNVVNQLISIGVGLIFALLCLLFSGVHVPRSGLLAALAILVVLDVAGILFNHAFLRTVFSMLSRLLKRSLSVFEVKKSLLIRLHLIQLAASVTTGLAAYLFCFALGYRIDLARSLIVIGSSILGDVAGFLAIIVPGGLGVREGLMYALLSDQGVASLALVLPIASRLLNMVVEITLGLVAFRLLRTLSARGLRPEQVPK